MAERASKPSSAATTSPLNQVGSPNSDKSTSSAAQWSLDNPGAPIEVDSVLPDDEGFDGNATDAVSGASTSISESVRDSASRIAVGTTSSARDHITSPTTTPSRAART